MPSRPFDRTPASLNELVQQLSARYVRGASFTDIFEALLPDLLAVTDSGMGFIAHLGHDDQGPLLQAVAHSTHTWQTTAPSTVFTDLGQGHLVFRDFNTLFGQVITTGQTLITNDVQNDPRAKGTPPEHTPLHQFLGIPLHHGGTLVGMLALANRTAGYDMALVEDLRAVVSVLANIVGAIDLERANREASLARSQAQDSLKRNEAYYEQMFEAAGVGIACVTPEGRILSINQRYADICQRPRSDLLRLNLLDITHPDDLAVNQALLQATLQGHQDRYTMDKRYLVPQGGEVWVQINAVLVRDELGQPQHFVTVAEDISERRRYQEAILSAQAAERASKAKTEFLSRMSHELRTPLNAMLGFAQLLRVDPRHPLMEPQLQKVRYIEQAGAHLLAMLTDVLDLSRIEAGSLPLSLEPLRIAEVVQEALTLVAHQGVERGIALSQTDIDPTLHVRADQVRLRQILVNLLSNAIKYNRPQGQVRVEVQPLGSQVMVAVHDTGMGLSAEQQAHLFEPFNRLGAERTGVEGTGIGLVIVHRLITLMNGRIEVSSLPDQGSVFRIVLPWVASPALDGLEAAGPRSGFGELSGLGDECRPLTVLYAEDNAVNVELVRHVMRMRPQWQLEVATNGADAIEMALTQPPDLLLLDMHLGDMTGLDVADALSHHPHTMSLLKVALSADVMPDQVRATRERGFMDYLTKPLEVPRLLKLLDAFAPLETAGPLDHAPVDTSLTGADR